MKLSVLLSDSPPVFQFSHAYFKHDKPVTVRQIHKDLGVIMSSDLSWKEHYVYLSSKVYKTLGLLWRTFSLYPDKDGPLHHLFGSSSFTLFSCLEAIVY